MISNYYIFKYSSEECVIDALAKMFNLKLEKVESSKLISLAILPYLKNKPAICFVEFNLLCAHKLNLTFISDVPLEFDMPLLQQAFKDSGIKLYKLYKTNGNYFKLLNLTTNHYINITSAPKLFSQLFSTISPCWKDKLKQNYSGNPKKLTDKDFKFFISDRLEALLDYFQTLDPNPLLCWT